MCVVFLYSLLPLFLFKLELYTFPSSFESKEVNNFVLNNFALFFFLYSNKIIMINVQVISLWKDTCSTDNCGSSIRKKGTQ